MRLLSVLREKPIILALKNDKDIELAVKSSAKVVFLLGGNIFEMIDPLGQLKQSGKSVFLHVDMMGGVARDAHGIEYLAKQTPIDGIVTTRSNLIQCAKTCGMITVQRLFLLDSYSLNTGIKMVEQSKPDAVEMLPGLVIPRLSSELKKRIKLPIIAGGFINELADAELILQANVVGLSTSSRTLWQWQDGQPE
ncbi:glycerol-3-phosphate responsive antiterminator [Effusibacillus pohliae]|uniref:glycerol-3-phosphate responsive antiterminator n=1 Tax=Effusibacillus pohliae TaxID=232270 RepID=UPI00036045AC|nr:glycerol-3-phosphate responsive antiterminator [Effusibacillus pohliae]